MSDQNSNDSHAKSYGSYLRLDELLDLQTTLTEAHDELQFIVVHQVSELWFKLVLFELTAARQAMFATDLTEAVHYLRRVKEILRVFIGGLDVIETMRPYDFLAFRERLQPASGFQSTQFRELEFLCGVRDSRFLSEHSGSDRARLEKRMLEPTIWDGYIHALKAHNFDTVGDSNTVSSVIQVLKERDRHPLGTLTECMFDFDETVALWRQRHILMTMRMIGSRPGTGRDSVTKFEGESYGRMSQGGVEYLRTTLPKHFFPLLWEARTFIER